MLRAVAFLIVLLFSPTVVAAQAPCTTDARWFAVSLWRARRAGSAIPLTRARALTGTPAMPHNEHNSRNEPYSGPTPRG
jgi:hypothetical protein